MDIYFKMCGISEPLIHHRHVSYLQTDKTVLLISCLHISHFHHFPAFTNLSPSYKFRKEMEFFLLPKSDCLFNQNTFYIRYSPVTYIMVITGDYGEQRAIPVKSCSDYSENKPHGRFWAQRLWLQKLQLAAGPRPTTWSVFIPTAGRTIITVQNLNSLSRDLAKETCYCHTDVSKLCVGIWMQRQDSFTSQEKEYVRFIGSFKDVMLYCRFSCALWTYSTLEMCYMW